MNLGFKRIPRNISEVSESVYNNLDEYVGILDGVARLTNQCISLIDFYKQEILYVSNNPLFLNGLPVDEVKKMGGAFNRTFVPEFDIDMIVEVLNSWFSFIEDKTVKEKLNYVLNLDYLLVNKYVTLRLNTAFLSEDGRPWLVVANVHNSTSTTSGNAFIIKFNSNERWDYSSDQKRWVESQQIILNEMELKILRLSVQGKIEDEICEEIYRSKDGLKSIKRRMFHKMKVSNITEAVSYAISCGLI